MYPPRICTVMLLGVALLAVWCRGRRLPEQWQTYVSEFQKQVEARRLAATGTTPVATISECRDGRPEYEYICKRTSDDARRGVHTTETIGYTFVRDFWGKDPDLASEKVLTQKH